MVKILLFFNLIILSSCYSNSTKDRIVNSDEIKNETEVLIAELPSEDDYKIINSTFVHLVLTAPPGHERKFGYDNYLYKGKNIPEEYINEIYFTQYLADVLDSSAFVTELKLSEEYLSKLNDVDFENLGRELISTKKISLKLDTAQIQKYRIKEIDSC